MRIAWLLMLLTLVVPVQNKSETYGKTNAQIRAMGYERWSDFYADKAGHTTLAMNDGAILFAAALNDGNQKRLAKLPRVDRARIRARLKAVESISDVLMDARSRIGGSMWVTMRAQQQIYNEQFATRLITAAVQPPPFNTVSTKDVEAEAARVRRRWDAIQALLNREPPDVWDPQMSKPATMKELAASRNELNALIKAIGKGRPWEGLVTLRYLTELTSIELFRRDE